MREHFCKGSHGQRINLQNRGTARGAQYQKQQNQNMTGRPKKTKIRVLRRKFLVFLSISLSTINLSWSQSIAFLPLQLTLTKLKFQIHFVCSLTFLAQDRIGIYDMNGPCVKLWLGIGRQGQELAVSRTWGKAHGCPLSAPTPVFLITHRWNTWPGGARRVGSVVRERRVMYQLTPLLPRKDPEFLVKQCVLVLLGRGCGAAGNLSSWESRDPKGGKGRLSPSCTRMKAWRFGRA